MSLYKNSLTEEIKEIEDSLYQQWGINNNPKADIWAVYTPIVAREAKETDFSPSESGKSDMLNGFVQILDSNITSESYIFPNPGFLPLGRIYWQVQAGIGFTINSTNNTDSGPVSWIREIPNI